MYDLTDRQSFEHLERWRKGFLDNCGPTNPATFPFVLLGNKIDRQEDRMVPIAEGQKWAEQNFNMPFYETSATEGTHVEEVFVQMAIQALKRD